jgi:CubicO group peptidase (beta-lactamase class C family)
MQFHLQGGVNKKGKRILNQSTIKTFWKREKELPYDNSRALGWDTVPEGQYPPCGHLFSHNSIGHTGYTGTTMWGDRDRDLIIVFLTNRVHPSDIDITVRKVRSLISDAIVR